MPEVNEATAICEGCGETVPIDDLEDGLCSDCRNEEEEEAGWEDE